MCMRRSKDPEFWHPPSSGLVINTSVSAELNRLCWYHSVHQQEKAQRHNQLRNKAQGGDLIIHLRDQLVGSVEPDRVYG